MESWIDIINDDAADGTDDRIILPQKQQFDLDSKGTMIKEVEYKFDDTNPDQVIRTETKYDFFDPEKFEFTKEDFEVYFKYFK